jgi:hypothetical protein
MATNIRELEVNELKAVIGGAVYTATATMFRTTTPAQPTARGPVEFTLRQR